MEEMLAAELEQEESHIAHRAAELLRELTVAPSEGGRLPGAEEMAATAWRTLLLPEIAELRPRLVPEWPLYAMVAGGGKPSALAGRIDAIAFDDGRADVLVDWKSDIDPTEEAFRFHAGQLRDYLTVSGPKRGAVVYMTPGYVRWIDSDPALADDMSQSPNATAKQR